MKSALIVAVALSVNLIAASPGSSGVIDPECMKSLEAASTQARKRIAVYQGELKGIKDVPTAGSAVSICGSALARAEQYYKKGKAGDSICTVGSAYVDGQVLHLFKNATITCRSEITTVLDRLPPDQQAPIAERIRQKEAEAR